MVKGQIEFLLDNVLVASPVVRVRIHLAEGSQGKVHVRGSTLSSRINTDIRGTSAPRTLQDTNGDVMITGFKDCSASTEKIALRAELRISHAISTILWFSDGPETIVGKNNWHTIIKDLENVSWAEASRHLDDGSLSGVQDKDLIAVCVLGTVGHRVPTSISHHGHKSSVNAEESSAAIITKAIIVHKWEFQGIGVDI